MNKKTTKNNISHIKIITRIEVSKLFDIFDYDIPLNSDMHITIIHGLNGYGKTTLLNMIDIVFNAQPPYNDLKKIPFKSFTIHFTDKSILTIKKETEVKETKSRKIGKSKLQFDYYDSVSNDKHSYTEPDHPERRFDRGRTEFEQVGPLVWIHKLTGEILTRDEIMERYGDLSVIEREPDIPEWLSEIRKSLKIRFIQSQRLLLPSSQQEILDYRQKTQMSLAVTKYAKELSGAIQSKLGEYAATSQSLDRNFPVRLVRQADRASLTAEEIREKLSDLETKRGRLIDAGLLEKDPEENFQIDEIDEQQKNILSVYIKDVNQKLEVLNDIADKIDLFKQIINDHFKHKYLLVDKNKGFTFFTKNHKPLAPENLSTGEQHQLILVYESLFKVESNSLILIDEPEISLHVEWQVQFLKDLQNIIELSKFDVLIATHSPQIINDRWDLTIRLSGDSHD